MPELPDVEVYVERLRAYVLGRELERVDLHSAFVLRTAQPPLESVHGQGVRAVERLGKRIVFEFDSGHMLVLHLMIAGRLRWRAAGKKPSRANLLAALAFEHGTLVFTEASKKKRASLHVLANRAELAGFDRRALEVLDSDAEAFAAAMTRRNHTLKRALTDPGILSGIGNAYSDEILFHARLSPFKQSQSLAPQEMARLHGACVQVLTDWLERTRAEVGDGFPDKVTAFREGMAVHGRYKAPCPVCGAPVQRIVYAENEANYCARCQTGGRLLADRALSRLLKANWPKTLDELEQGTG